MAAGVVAAGLMGDEHARLSRGAGRCEPRRGRGSPRETGLRLGAPAALSQPHWQTQNDDDNWKTARLHGTPASLQHCHRHYQGRRYWGLGVLTPLNMSEGQSMLWPLKVTFFYSKLLLDNSASFKIIKDQKLVSKMKGNFFEAPEWYSSMAWPDWPWSLLFYHRPTPLFITVVYCLGRLRESKERIKNRQQFLALSAILFHVARDINNFLKIPDYSTS